MERVLILMTKKSKTKKYLKDDTDVNKILVSKKEP